MKQKAKLVFSVASTCLLASHIIHPQSNLAFSGRLTPAQLQLVNINFMFEYTLTKNVQNSADKGKINMSKMLDFNNQSLSFLH